MEEKLQTFTQVDGPADERPAVDLIPSTERYPLPSLQEVLPMVEHYFCNFNSLTPIFLRSSFMRMLHQWYSPSASHDAASWAAINIVLALSQQACATDKVDRVEVRKHVDNAQSALTTLLAGEQDLKAIQVLIGLAMLFLSTPMPLSASILIATAVKLVHRLQLHTKSAHNSLSADLALERGHVFWITYILDKDINMRTHEPYLLQEKDIDVELPDYFNAHDMEGTLNMPTWFNLLESRVHLARIQGSSYDWTYTAQAEKFSHIERLENSRKLHHMLCCWRQSIPDMLQPENFHNSVPTFAVRHFLLLYFTYFRTVYVAHRVFSQDAEWIVRLVNYSQIHVVEFYQGRGKYTAESVLPADWPEILKLSRTCMRLFHIVDQSDLALVWCVLSQLPSRTRRADSL
jgi:hypothetical protein